MLRYKEKTKTSNGCEESPKTTYTSEGEMTTNYVVRVN